MTKKVYSLKHSTGREQARHMRAVMDFKSNLREHQDTYTPPVPVLCGCGNEIEKNPMQAGICYDCYRASLDTQPFPIPCPPAPEHETIAEESARIDQWLSDNWDFIPEIPFGEEA